jgi:hypothetical protein
MTMVRGAQWNTTTKTTATSGSWLVSEKNGIDPLSTSQLTKVSRDTPLEIAELVHKLIPFPGNFLVWSLLSPHTSVK